MSDLLPYWEAEEIIGKLSQTTKMPGYSWSISARGCKTGGKLREIKGSTCASCYALKGHYNYPNVKNAMARREAGLDHPRFVDAFVTVLLNVKPGPFRWFDSGDLRSLDHLEKINSVALRTPQIEHWLPTRELMIVKSFLKKHTQFAPNLTVRISAPMIGQRPRQKPHGLPYSTVDVDDPDIHQCPAPQQGNQCGDCRACWNPDINVNYKKH